MTPAELERFVEEIKSFELDPESTNTQRIYKEYLAITSTLDLSSTARCRSANAIVASVSQAVIFKLGRCHYWEKKISQSIDYARAEATKAVFEITREKGTKIGKEELESLIELEPKVSDLAKKLSAATASRYFWEHILDGLKRAGDRVENNIMSFGIDAKMQDRV